MADNHIVQKHAHGTSTVLSQYNGPEGEIVIDVTDQTIRVQNGEAGGVPLAKKSEVSALDTRVTALENAGGGDYEDRIAALETKVAVLFYLESLDWEVIKSCADKGIAKNVFNIGDTKTIHVEGTVGTLAVNQDCKVRIIDFDHDSVSGIYFQCFTSTDDKDVALTDSKYNNTPTDGTRCFNMNHWGNSNHGGWRGCDLRYDVLGSTDVAPSGYGSAVITGRMGYDATAAATVTPIANTLMAALPADLRNVLAPFLVYTDGVGYISNAEANVVATVDYLPLLAEYEIRGERGLANQYEQNYQSQMTYYKNGASKVRYRHSATTMTCSWWIRSAYSSSDNYFCFITIGGSMNVTNTSYSLGLAPFFRVASTPSYPTLEDATWEQIKEAGASGFGALYWNVGDTKTIHVEGTVGTLAVNQDFKVKIIEFNYRGDKGIYFQGFTTTINVEVALTDSKYGGTSANGPKYFNMNHWSSLNYGGWRGCDLRYDVLGSTDVAPSGYGAAPVAGRMGYNATSTATAAPIANTLMAALPADLRAVLAPWTIYADGVGNSSNAAANVVATVDYLPLLAEYEIHGARTQANQYEQNYQTQMTYYKNGASKIRYQHSATSSACHWWVRSASYLGSTIFCCVLTSGSASGNTSYISYGLAPAFRVA